MEIKGITIHNTGNDKSAKELFEILKKEQRVNTCHFLVDDENIINIYSVDECASHTGRGYDFGNRFTIAIEICKSSCDLETYLKAEDKAIELIKQLLDTYQLSKDDIYFHCDFNKIKCPHRILDLYNTKGEFINERII